MVQRYVAGSTSVAGLPSLRQTSPRAVGATSHAPTPPARAGINQVNKPAWRQGYPNSTFLSTAVGVTWHTFGTFLEQQGLWRAERVRAWLSVCNEQLSRLALAQGTLVTEERASLVFLQAVRSLVASGRAILHDLEGGTPEVAPAQVLIGGVDRTGTYLITPATYDLVCEYKRRAGQVVPWSQRALVQMLEQDGLLVSTDTDGRHKAVVRVINGQRVRCWHLPVHVLGNA